MRRTLSLALVLLFCFPLISPLFASSPEMSLPACCRRGGAHHCMAAAVQGAGGFASLKQHCPSLPKAVAVVGTGRVFVAGTQVRFADVVAHPTAHPQTEARYRVSFGRSRQKRGPPSFFL